MAGVIRFLVYRGGVEWEIEATDEFFAWSDGLKRSDAQAREALDAVIDMLAERGPMMRRPYVGEIVTSRHHNMKELRVPASRVELRVLFCFDPRRMAISLLAGTRARERRGTPGTRRRSRRRMACTTSTSRS